MSKEVVRRQDVFRMLDQCFGNDTVTEDFLGAMRRVEAFPEKVYTLYYEEGNTFYCIETPVDDSVRCLVTMGSREVAEACITAMNADLAEGCKPIPMTLDEARQVAHADQDIKAMILVGQPDHMLMQYVN